MGSLLVPLLLWSLLTAKTSADKLTFLISTDCLSNMNYSRGSAFQANLAALLSSLPAAAAASTGFATNVTGAPPDQAYGLAQCRGDVSAPDCRSCLDDTARQMARTCPGQKSAMLIYEGCQLWYSNTTFFGTSDTGDPILQLSGNIYVDQPEQFQSRLGQLMSNLREAAYGSPRKFAAGSVKHTGYMTLHGAAQCRRDIRPDNCNQCLAIAIKTLPKCCSLKDGGRVYGRTCSVRFESYPFYATQAAMSPTPAPGRGPAVNDDTNRSGTRGNTVRTSLIITAVTVVAVVTLMLAALYICKRNRKPHKHVKIASDKVRSSEAIMFDSSTLRAATGNFSEQNRLGEGGFGPVYKGMLQDGQEIAVKRLSATSQQGQVEMKNEVFLVAKLQHKNLVRLLGCCIEEDEKLLVYEFLCNKSLDKILFGPARQRNIFSWEQKYKIIEGISRGLLYLHEDSRLTIVHRDLKPGNILLDEDMNPKISDFGLAKLFKIEASVANTRHIAGTYGYMAPEYALHGIFSTKSDVFSYGVLVLEIVTGRRPSEGLLSLVWKHWSDTSLPPLLDGCPGDDEGGKQEMLRCIHLGLLCVQEDPQCRPRMASVVGMLNSRSITLPVPTKPAYVGPADRPRMAAREMSSINEVSISELEPR